MEINEEAIDYVFCHFVNAKNVEDAVWRIFGRSDLYASQKKEFIKEFNITITQKTIKIEEIYEEIKTKIHEIEKIKNIRAIRKRFKQQRNRRKS